MNREIKFRGKDYTNKWRTGDLVQEKWGQGKAIMIKKDKRAWSVLEDTVGQYTGLQDKNAVEIYEGDIVYVTNEDENAKIAWCQEACKFILEFDSDWISDFDSFYGKELEVIGNIYDNPELIEKEGK